MSTSVTYDSIRAEFIATGDPNPGLPPKRAAAIALIFPDVAYRPEDQRLNGDRNRRDGGPW